MNILTKLWKLEDIHIIVLTMCFFCDIIFVLRGEHYEKI